MRSPVRTTSIGFADPRQEQGELLCPERFEHFSVSVQMAFTLVGLAKANEVLAKRQRQDVSNEN